MASKVSNKTEIPQDCIKLLLTPGDLTYYWTKLKNKSSKEEGACITVEDLLEGLGRKAEESGEHLQDLLVEMLSGGKHNNLANMLKEISKNEESSRECRKLTYEVRPISLESILEEYPRAEKISKKVLFQCFRRIRPFLNLDVLSDYLMEYGVVTSSEDSELLTSSFYLPQDKLISLVKMLETAGTRGFAACYASLKKSGEYTGGHRGHADAVFIIDEHDTTKESSTEHLPTTGKVINRAMLPEIEPLLNLKDLCDYLMEYGIVTSGNDMEAITSSHCKPEDRISSLMTIVEREGGGVAFIRALEESAAIHSGHQEVLDIISKQHDVPSEPSLSNPEDVVRDLEYQFCDLSNSLFTELSNQDVPKVIKCLRSFPAHLKRELLKTINENFESLKRTREIDLLNLSLDRLWNFIDYDLLDHIIFHLGSNELKSKMSDYVTRLINFKKTTTVSCLIQSWRACQDPTPVQCQEVAVRVDFDPNVCTLERLNSIRKSLADYFLPPLSQFVMFYKTVMGGSIVVTWILPHGLGSQLAMCAKSPDSIKFLKQLRILSLHIDDIAIYPVPEISLNELSLKPTWDEVIDEFIKDNSDIQFIGKSVFQECYNKIKAWINIQDLVPYLVKFHLLNEEDKLYLTGSLNSPMDKCNHLLRVAEAKGKNGYMLLYVCLLESTKEIRPHVEVVAELNKAAEKKAQVEETTSENVDENVDEDSLSSLEEEKHPTVENKIYSLIDYFSRTAVALLQELESEKCNIEVIQNQLRVLPGYLNNEVFINTCSTELTGSECDSIQMLFDVLHMKMWNFLDYHLLKFLVDNFGTKDSKGLMNSYEEQLDQFLMSTPVQSLAKHWDGQNTKPANGFVEFEVKFSSSYIQEAFTAELNEFLKKVVSSFLPTLSKMVIVHQRFRLDGSLVTYVLPLELAMQLKQGISELQSQQLFEQYFVEYMTVDNQAVYEAENIAPDSTKMIRCHLRRPSLQSLEKIEVQISTSVSSKESVQPPYTPISVRGVGSVVHQTSSSSVDKQLEEELPEIDAATSPQSDHFSLQVLFCSQVEKQKRRNYGCFPSIAVNNGGVVVEVSHKMYTRWMLYRVGLLKDQKVNWEVSAKASKTYYGTGSYPRIAINDRNTVVEVHGGDFREKCYYRVGKVEPEKGTITWCASKSFEKKIGHYPCVALTRANHVIVVYQRDILTKALCYRVGTLNSGLISWDSVHNLSIRADNFSVDVNNHNTVILAFQTFNLRIRYSLGKLESDKGTIQWEKPEGMFAGMFPNVSLNDDGYVVLVHKSYLTQSLFSSIGKVFWDGSSGKIWWSQKERKGAEQYGSGQYPSVCMNDKGDMVEAHMAVFPNIYLCYNAGLVKSC